MDIQRSKVSLKNLFPDLNHQTWGLKWAEIYFDGMTWRGVKIDKLFYYHGRNAIGLNIKFLHECWVNNVTKLIIFVGENSPYTEYLMGVPARQTIKYLKKINQYEDKPSNYADQGGLPMRIYYFKL